MLVLTRRSGQSVMLNDSIEITVLSVFRGKVRIGISAPSDVLILRKELALEITNDPCESDPAPAAER